MMQTKIRSLLVAAALATVLSGVVTAAEDVLTMATTTSTENSGLLGHIHPDFEKQTGIRLKVVAKGTGASLQLARDGNADVVLVHARDLEIKFVEEGYGVLRRDVMYNDFVILGPKHDPGKIDGMEDPAKALERIAGGEHLFISRGDASGTHLREQQLWSSAGARLETTDVTMILGGKEKSFSSVRPVGDWYRSIGQGMGKTIMVATQMRAYTLADRGTYYAFALSEPARTDLAILVQGHNSLHNPYGVIAVSPKRHPHVNFTGAKKYIDWITSPEVQKMIGAYRVRGRALFHPGATASDGP